MSGSEPMADVDRVIRDRLLAELSQSLLVTVKKEFFNGRDDKKPDFPSCRE